MKVATLVLSLLLICPIALAQPNYSGAYGAYPHCQACHNSGSSPTNQFPYWNASLHASAYDSHPELQWDPVCVPCHTTGWDLTLNNGGFDDFFYAGDTLGMQEMRNVQCEACHGPTSQIPHPPSTVVDYHAEVCGGCHTGLGKPAYDEWTTSGHGSNASIAAQQLPCAKCHEAASAKLWLSTGSPPTSLPDDPVWQIACPSCHAVHERTVFDPQLFLAPDSTCRACHNMDGAVVGEVPHATQQNMIRGVGYGAYEWPGYTYANSCHQCVVPGTCVMCHMDTTDYSGADPLTTGHTFAVRLETCIVCHPAWVPPDSSFNFQGVQSEMDSLLLLLAAALAQADTTTAEYAQAKFDYDFVMADGSRGIHNAIYASALLISSIENLPPVGVKAEFAAQSSKFRLESPCSNPFNSTTVLSYELRVSSFVKLDIYDVSGRLVTELVNGWREAGLHKATFDGSELPSGIYLYRLQEGNYKASGKMALVR